MNAIQEAIAPVGQPFVTTAPTVSAVSRLHGSVGTTGREPSMEFQMRNKTFISSMVGIAAAVAVAGSANAAIVTGPGTGSDCATLNPSTSTTITYTGSWSSQTVGTFYMGFGVCNASYVGAVSGLEVTNIQYSTDSGVNWTLGASSYTTGTTTYGGFSTASNAPASAAAGTWAFSFTNNGSGFPGGINGSTLRVRATLSATSSIPNDYKFYGFATGQWAEGAGRAFSGGYVSTAVPAPGAFALLGVAGLVGARRRRA